MQQRQRFDPEASSAREARAFVAAALPDHDGLDARVALAVSEVASNAILYARAHRSRSAWSSPRTGCGSR